MSSLRTFVQDACSEGDLAPQAPEACERGAVSKAPLPGDGSRKTSTNLHRRSSSRAELTETSLSSTLAGAFPTDRGTGHAPLRVPRPAYATTASSCSRAPRRRATWACRWRRSAAGPTPATSAATARRAASGASRASSWTSSSPRCSATDGHAAGGGARRRRVAEPHRRAAPQRRAAQLSWPAGRTSRAAGGRTTSRAAARSCRRR